MSKQGWSPPSVRNVRHYFRSEVSLCGKWEWSVPIKYVTLRDSWHDSGANCQTCMKLRAKQEVSSSETP